jgi:hypothetical protein
MAEMPKMEVKIVWSCSDYVHHEHTTRFGAWLCGRWQWLRARWTLPREWWR